MEIELTYHDAGSSKLGPRYLPSTRLLGKGLTSVGSGSSKLGPRDLPSKRLLGTGLASVGYETELNGKKCARKDFMGVPSGTFRREAGRLVGLEDHINVVKTLDWTENNMSCSLVLEYMDDDLLGFLQKRKQSQGSLEAGPSSGNQSGLDSRNTIKLAPFKLPEALDVMLQIARGMEYLADKGIRHGNLKTKNILVTHANDRDRNSLSVKVADFGLVRTRRKSTSFASRQARKLDMARWTAPENLEVFLLEDKGETSSESDSDEDCTHPSDVLEWRELGADVYSFAVTCSQILTGEDPYPLMNWKKLGVNIVRHGLEPILPAACPPELRELLVSCWGFDHDLISVRGRPSFSHICRTLERLLQMGLPAPDLHLHGSHHLLENAPMDIREPMRGKEPTDVVREIGLWEPITVEDLGLPEPITVEYSGRSPFLDPYLRLASDVAGLIARTRTVVRRRAEWTQLREELELMLPDMLRIRNRLCSWDKAGELRSDGGKRVRCVQMVWKRTLKLRCAVRDTFREVEKYQEEQEDDRSLLSSAFTEPRRLSKLRNDWNQVAKQLKVILTELLRGKLVDLFLKKPSRSLSSFLRIKKSQ